MIPALSRWATGVLIVAAIGAVIGWSIRARIADTTEKRLEAEVVFLTSKVDAFRANTKVLRNNVSALENALNEQNESILTFSRDMEAVRQREKAARKALADHLARPTPTPIVLTGTCDEMVEQIRLFWSKQ